MAASGAAADVASVLAGASVPAAASAFGAAYFDTVSFDMASFAALFLAGSALGVATFVFFLSSPAIVFPTLKFRGQA